MASTTSPPVGCVFGQHCRTKIVWQDKTNSAPPFRRVALVGAGEPVPQMHADVPLRAGERPGLSAFQVAFMSARHNIGRAAFQQPDESEGSSDESSGDDRESSDDERLSSAQIQQQGGHVNGAVFGDGFYFTDDKHVAMEYAKKTTDKDGKDKKPFRPA
eukprot:SAG22_NODE_5577_length_990_cov_2.491582_2_plen_159_part_00